MDADITMTTYKKVIAYKSNIDEHRCQNQTTFNRNDQLVVSDFSRTLENSSVSCLKFLLGSK